MMFKGLDEAMEKFEKTSGQMDAIAAGIENVVKLLEEQNEYLRMLSHRV